MINFEFIKVSKFKLSTDYRYVYRIVQYVLIVLCTLILIN